jgi:hypothetical protein
VPTNEKTAGQMTNGLHLENCKVDFRVNWEVDAPPETCEIK